MTVLYEDLSEIIPFDVDRLIKPGSYKLLTEEDIDVKDWFIHKQNLDVSVLEENFTQWLIDRGVPPRRVIVWHWLCSSPDIAHIDCDSNGEIATAALNWTATNKKSWVQFYDMPGIEKTVMYGNQADTSFKTDNVSAYIPVNVNGIEPSSIWNTRGPALLNISEPHLIVAPEMRTAISIQFDSEEPFKIILGKIKNG